MLGFLIYVVVVLFVFISVYFIQFKSGLSIRLHDIAIFVFAGSLIRAYVKSATFRVWIFRFVVFSGIIWGWYYLQFESKWMLRIHEAVILSLAIRFFRIYIKVRS